MTVTTETFHTLISGRRRGPKAVLLRGALRLASVPYGWAAAVRNKLFDWGWKGSTRAAVPVVSVGNLTVGGTGKTPCVEYVCRFYRRLDLRVAILSRGYGAEHGPNDEALVLEENLPDVPHLQGPDRVALAQTAVEELESEVLVLDDAFQHRRLARDLDVVLVDATNPWGHGYVLPRGLLRESRRGLKRAGVIVLTRCDQVSEPERGRLRWEVARFAPAAPLVETKHAPVSLVNSEQCSQLAPRVGSEDQLAPRVGYIKSSDSPLSLLGDWPVAGFCGIGNPAAFRRTLADLGASVCAFRTFADHHPYTREDVEELRRWAQQQATDCIVITTQKDLVKLRLPDLAGRPLWALRVELRPMDEGGMEPLDHQLRAILGG